MGSASPRAGESSFSEQLITALFRSLGSPDPVTHDPWRFPIEHGRGRGFLHRHKRTPGDVRSAAVEAAHQLETLWPSLTELDWVWRQLADEDSKATLVRVWAYRLLGPEFIKMPIDTEVYWDQRKTIQPVPRAVWKTAGWVLEKFPVDLPSGRMFLWCSPLNVQNTFLSQQYAYTPAGIGAAPGDIVLDGGGCWGDTALYFADRVGREGRVFTFEFVSENLAVMERNLDMNDELGSVIDIVRSALWKESREELHFTEQGPSTRVDETDALGKGTSGVAIDDFVLERGLGQVDFIKLDIEGSELSALEGARETIRRFRPQLAISVYHKPEDFWTIPQLIDSLGPKYRFFLGHFTSHQEETILFARED